MKVELLRLGCAAALSCPLDAARRAVNYYGGGELSKLEQFRRSAPEQRHAADRNERVCHREVVRFEVVSRRLMAGVSLLL